MTEVKTKKSDQFPTDYWLYTVFEDWFDPCPLDENPSINGLEIEWYDRTYINPPYSNPLPWVRKAIETSKEGKRVVMLLKFDSTTKWFKLLMQANAHILYVGERLKHGGNYSAPFASMLVILERDVE